MTLPDPVRAQIDDLVKKAPVVLFMKGTKHFPQCGFSATVVGILGEYGAKFETVNVLSSPEIRDGIKEYSSWPTIPQLYVNGQFVGGCDIVREMHESGELGSLLGKPKAEAKPPTIKLSPEAAKAILAASKDAGGDPLRIEIGPRFEVDLYFDSKADGDFLIEQGGVHIIVAKDGAARADGLTVDYVKDAGFRVDNPNAPPRVKSLSASELKRLLDGKEPLELLDVRTDDEMKTAKIAGSKPLSGELVAKLPKAAKIVVYCHHGMRSKRAADQLVAEGYSNVYNLEGGIDAYSAIEPSVPRY
jgi:monothiol glutaredoxin